jgi:quercetin dioxygenase-like cupin family protein
MAREQKIAKAKTLKLTGILSYQKGSIVSRQIINKNYATVTIFSFDKGESLSEHIAPFDAMVYIIEGAARVLIEGISHVLKKGEMIIMPANRPHALKAVRRFKMLLIMVRS